MGMTIAEIRALTDAELDARYDEIAQSSSPGIAFYRDEIARRQADRQTQMIVRLTWAIAAMTLAVLAATVVSTIYVARAG